MSITTAHDEQASRESFRRIVSLDELKYVIWSEEHGRWWAKGKRGYTAWLRDAAVFSNSEAEKIVSEANAYCMPGEFREVAFAVPPELERHRG